MFSTSFLTSPPVTPRTPPSAPVLLEDGLNWILYKEQFLAVVISKKLQGYLMGTERRPVPTTAPGVDPDADTRVQGHH